MDEYLLDACTAIVSEIERVREDRERPIVVAIDGESGSGKSTIAPLIAQELDAALIHTDDFFSGQIPDQDWDNFSIPERYEKVLDWIRIREEAVKPLLAGGTARWRAFDFAAGLQDDGTYSMEPSAKVRGPAKVVILEGAYCASPKLSDLIDLTILLDVPIERRHGRLLEREDPGIQRAWHARWDEVEAFYRREVMPRSSYDLVIELE